jgi:FKBP-type peptidyl-prolyl cis-trans isomerase (trigger factor)
MCGILEFKDLATSFYSSHSQNEITIGPNPANSYINIDLSGQNNNTEISILDIKGSLVLKKTASSNNIQLNISNFQQGLYFISVNTGSNRILKKLVRAN